jgi:hypothetical protein
MRDGLYCPFVRWALVCWSPRPVVPDPQHFDFTACEVLAKSLETFGMWHELFNPRYCSVCHPAEAMDLKSRLAADGLTQRQIADKLEIRGTYALNRCQSVR